MQQNSINEIKINDGKQKLNRFNFSHDNNTSYDWGSVQPLLNKEMQPNSSANIEIESLLRLAPMVVPTFGRVRVKNTAHFIKYQELWPNWDAMLGRKPVTRPTTIDGKQSNTTFVPTKVPSIAADLLSCFTLTGARMSLWSKLNTTGSLKNAWVQYGVSNSKTADNKIEKRNILEKFLTKCLGMSNSGQNIDYIEYSGPVAQLTNLAKSVWAGYGVNPAKPRMPINTYAYDVDETENEKYGNPNIAMMNEKTFNVSAEDKANWLYQVKMSEADVAIDIEIPVGKTNSLFDILTDDEFSTLKTYFKHIGLAFKLSNFGKRLRKVLITSGYPIDFNCDDEYSVLPLMAYYYAWWLTYAPERTKNYYSSNQYKLIQETLNGNDNCLTDKFKKDNSIATIIEWLYDIGNCYATEKMDVFAAATENPNLESDDLVYNPLNLEQLSPWYQTHITASSDDAPDYAKSKEPILKITGPGAEISQQQLEMLKKLYRITNKTSAAGQNLGETLKALGQGKDVEESRGIFINSGETPIKISDVVAQSASEERPLGDWGGKGMGHGVFKVNYKTDCYGVITVISCIIPESGYVNGADNTLKDITRDSKPNPEFDGITVEAIEKKQIQGVVQTSNWGVTIPGGIETFGYVPTYTKYKYMTNKANGDFSLYSKRNSMQPYTIDKILPLQVTIEDTKKQAIVDQEKQYKDYDRYVEFTNVPMKWEEMPIAGEEWRYVSKYLWNGQYDRIFEMGVNANDYMGNEILQNNNSIILYNSTGYDNFMSHNVINFMYYMGMKAIEESYNTFDEEHAPNTSVKKQ